uniref:Phage integrase n=1 Tax=Rheinheimera sp. BAL341 TaxID=1708203 RepID=A0A486XGY6_9GAMM
MFVILPCLVYRYATLNTPCNLVRILRTLNFLINSEAELSSASLIQKLNKFSNLEYDGATEKFYTTLFILRQLVSIEYPGFEECEAEVEQLFRPAQNSFLIYQNIDNILSLADTSLIQNGLINAAHSLDELSIVDLKNICILGICYVTGARPVQLSKIAASDLKIDFGRDVKTAKYSLRLPLAKKSKKTTADFVIIKVPEELGFLLTNYINKINIKVDEQLFSSDNTVEMVNNAIRFALICFNPIETQSRFGMLELSTPALTSMDFRHNIGHTLAMRGASAEEIAYILGHSSTVAARHYIMATPELADIKARTLGINLVYQEMVAMLLTGDISSHERWHGDVVAGTINNQLHFGLGGCGKTGEPCPFSPVRSCYGCQDFHPFADADHISVLKDVQQEIEALSDLSDKTGSSLFSAGTVHEQTKFEVISVIARCKLYKDVDGETDH